MPCPIRHDWQNSECAVIAFWSAVNLCPSVPSRSSVIDLQKARLSTEQVRTYRCVCVGVCVCSGVCVVVCM